MNFRIQTLSILGSALVATGLVSAQEKAKPPAPIKLEEIPATFDVWQDSEGYPWQLDRTGSILSGSVQYFRGALTLFVNGGAFVPDEAIRLDGGEISENGAEIEFRKQFDGLSISRNAKFDIERSGMRILDTFTNTSKATKTFRVDLKSRFRESWQDLHGTDGRLLDTKPGVGLGPRDFGVVVNFPQSSAKHDTIFLTSGERDARKPVIAFASNNEELTFSYDIELKPGAKASLLNWVIQRNLIAPADAAQELRPLYSRRRLINPGVSADLAKTILNFDEQSFPGDGEEPFDLEALVNLNELTEKLGLDRRDEDVLRISSENQLAGTVNPEAKLTVMTQFGERSIGIGDLAAIEGGGGIGRTPRVFLRNGEVWSGNFTATKLSMKIAEGWDVDEIKPDEMNLLLCALDKADGEPAPSTDVFLEFRSGDVVGASAKDAALNFLSPWGADSVPLSQIANLRYTQGSTPKFRLHKRDGTRMTVFLTGDPISLGDSGEANSSDLVRVWRAGSGIDFAASAEDMDEMWLEFSDVGRLEELPAECCLLAGNNLLAGALKTKVINLISDQSVTPIEPGEVSEIRRSFEAGTDQLPAFEVELRNGDILTGHLRERMLTIANGEKEIEVPVQHFLGFRADLEGTEEE